MGFFRRSRSVQSKARNGKSKKRSSRNKSNSALTVETKNEKESSVGLLSPQDQFDLEIPMKNRQPVGILRIQSTSPIKSSRCMHLQGQKTPVYLPELDDIDHKSTVSSLSGVTQDFAPLRMKTTDHGNGSATYKTKSVPVMKVLGRSIRLDGSCCGITAHTEDTEDSNSILAVESESRRKVARWTVPWALCGKGPEEVKEIVKEPVSSPVNRRPQKFIRNTSLFDTLADEVEDTELNVAPAEAVTVASATSTRRSKSSKVSLLKSRSFRKARNLFNKGERKRLVR
jgi:hypothetical protein